MGSSSNKPQLIVDGKRLEPQGTIIRGPIAREISIRFPNITKIASKIVSPTPHFGCLSFTP